MGKGERVRTNREIFQYLKLVPIVFVFSSSAYLFNLVFAQLCSITMLGELNTLLFLIKLLIPYSSLGLGRTFTYFIPDYQKRGQDGLINGLLIFTFFISISVSLLLACVIFIYGLMSHSTVIMYGSLAFPLYALFKFFVKFQKVFPDNTVSMVLGRYAKHFFPLCAGVVCMFFSIQLTDNSLVFLFVLSIFVALLIQVIIGHKHLISLSLISFQYDRGTWFDFARHRLFNKGLVKTDYYLLIFIAQYFFGFEAVALYAVLISLSRFLTVPKFVFGYLVERKIRLDLENQKKKRHFLKQYLTVVLISSVIVLFFLLSFGKQLVFFVNDDLAKYNYILPLFFIAGFIKVVNMSIIHLLSYSGMIKALLVPLIISMILSAILFITFSIFFDIQGLAMAFLISKLFLCVLLLLLSYQGKVFI